MSGRRQWVSRTRGADAGAAARRPGRFLAQASPSLNLAPMIDVTFLLLIFFTVTTSFQKAEGYLAAKLPRDAGRPTVALPISPVVVRVEQYGPEAGNYRLGVDHFLNAPATFGELTQFLKTVQGNPGFSVHTPVVIAAEADVAWDHVVNCWNAVLRAGCRNISFGKQ